MLLCALFKWIPSRAIGNVINWVNQTAFKIWTANNAFLMKLTNKIEWDIQGLENVDKVKGSCIIICNHISWADIVMLAHVFRKHVPITKFFLKHSLIYIPVIGLVCYAIGMPFLRRYSREQLLKNPKLKTKDLDSTRKACLSLLEYPSTLINFVEGTRFTEEKAKASNSQYRNLMPPKAASLAVALGIIGNNIDCLLNTTFLYPHTQGNLFLALLCGRLKKMVVRVEKIEPVEEWVGDYLKDKQFKRKFTNNLRDLWQRKDEQLTQIKIAEGLIDPSQLSAPQEPQESVAAPVAETVGEKVAKQGEDEQEKIVAATPDQTATTSGQASPESSTTVASEQESHAPVTQNESQEQDKTDPLGKSKE